MQCPGCRNQMRELTLGAALGATVEVQACLSCRAFWFDPFESLQLTRSSTLELFQLISAQRTSGAPFPTDARCPVCSARLLLTHDRQRTTPFQYWRCDAGHGRFTPFLDFLREKEFIKPMSDQQIAALRQNIRMIRCSGCGAPVDLDRQTVCAYCGAQVSMLDVSKMREAVSAGPRPALPERRSPESELQRQVAALLASQPREKPEAPLLDLVDLGLTAVAKWWRG